MRWLIWHVAFSAALALWLVREREIEREPVDAVAQLVAESPAVSRSPAM